MWTTMLLLACSGPDPGPKGDDGGPTHDSAPPVDDTAPDGVSLEVAYWAVSAAFAIDGASGAAGSFGDREGGLTPMSFTVTLLTLDSLYQGVTDTNSCSATFLMDGPVPQAAWAVDEGAWAAFDLPLDGEVQDRCRFYSLPGVFAGELAPHVRRWSWGVGVLSLSEEVEGVIREQLPPSEWDAIAPYVFGAGVRSDLFGGGTSATGWVGDGYGLAFQVDANQVVVEDALGNPVPLDRELVWSDGGAGYTIGSGYYEVQIGVFDQPDALTFAPTY